MLAQQLMPDTLALTITVPTLAPKFENMDSTSPIQEYCGPKREMTQPMGNRCQMASVLQKVKCKLRSQAGSGNRPPQGQHRINNSSVYQPSSQGRLEATR